MGAVRPCGHIDYLIAVLRCETDLDSCPHRRPIDPCAVAHVKRPVHRPPLVEAGGPACLDASRVGELARKVAGNDAVRQQIANTVIRLLPHPVADEPQCI